MDSDLVQQLLYAAFAFLDLVLIEDLDGHLLRGRLYLRRSRVATLGSLTKVLLARHHLRFLISYLRSLAVTVAMSRGGVVSLLLFFLVQRATLEWRFIFN